jgi:hypothetical protein
MSRSTGDGPVARPLPTQDNTNTEETPTDIYSSGGIGIQERMKEFRALDRARPLSAARNRLYL